MRERESKKDAGESDSKKAPLLLTLRMLQHFSKWAPLKSNRKRPQCFYDRCTFSISICVSVTWCSSVYFRKTETRSVKLRALDGGGRPPLYLVLSRLSQKYSETSWWFILSLDKVNLKRSISGSTQRFQLEKVPKLKPSTPISWFLCLVGMEFVLHGKFGTFQ